MLRRVWSKLRSLAQLRSTKREIDEELRFHLEMRTAENMAAGEPPEQAARAARRRFGNVQSIREECREARGANFGETVLQDIRFGLRMLGKSPGFTTVVVTTLALGVGASTAIYSVVKTVLLDPVPGPEPERLVQIAERNFTQGNFKDQNNKPFFGGVSAPVLEALLANRDFFADFAWFEGLSLERKTEDFIDRVGGAMTSPNFFTLLNIQPLLGRTFAQGEEITVNKEWIPESDSVMVVSYSMWKSLFGGTPAVVGKTIDLSGRRFTVIGVMPAHFQPQGGYPQFWVPAKPLRLPPGWGTGPNIRVLARLKAAVTQQQAQAMLDTVSARLVKDHASDKMYGEEWRRRPQGLGLWIRSLRYEFQGGYGAEDLRRTLSGLLGAIGFVLLIVCANIANLTLARTERRHQELAIRAALGAGRARLMRQLVTENILLACLAGLAGLAVTALGMKLLVSLIPQSMPRLREIHIDAHALAFTLLLSVLTGLVFGLAPALRGGRTRLNEALKQAAAGATAGIGRSRYRSALVVGEVALALVLLAGAGLMIQSVIRLLHVNPGFDPENLLFVHLELPWKTYNDPEHEERASNLRNALFAQLHERLAALPGVKAVGLGKHGAWPEKLKVDGRGDLAELLLDGCGVEQSDLFRAMRIPLLAGRYFGREDIGEGTGTVIINETMARMFWPGADAVGKRFGGASPYGPRNYEVIGVVGDVRDYRYDQQVRPTFYRPCHELRLEGMAPFVVLRTQTDPRALIPAIRGELKAAEPEMRMPRILVVRQVLYDSTQAQRTYMLYLVAFAGVGLLLSAIGIYGVLAYAVARRTREIGIRVALGAERRHVLGMVIAGGVRLAVAGITLGLLAAYWLTQLLRKQLFEVSPTDPMVLAGVSVLLFLVSLLACYLPARRAMKINPMEALRYE